nr:hypothetical protein [Pandoravirus massiliensis]
MRLTANWYDVEEMACAQRTCVRRGMEADAVRVAIERDRSGDGVGVFATLAASCIEDVGLALPMSLSAVLVSMAMWEADTAAGKQREARAHLAAAVASVASWPKSRLVADAAIKTMEVDLDALVARMTTDMAFEEIGGHTLLTDSVAWGSALAEPAPSSRKVATAAAIEARGRIDAQRVVATFGALVRVACEVWSDGVTPADIAQQDTGEALTESPVLDRSLDSEKTHGTSPPSIPPDAIDKHDAATAPAAVPAEDVDAAALAEGTTLTIEEGTLALVHILVAMQDIEGRRVDWPPKGVKAASRPPFVDDAMRSISAEAGSAMARNCWPTLCGAGARDFFSRPVAWAFAPLLAMARSANCERAVMALLGLAEALARGLVHPRPALVAGVLMTVRHSTLVWDERRIDVQAVATRPDIAAALSAYDVPSVCDLLASGAASRESISAARSFVLDPERHLDGTTLRHAGRSTTDAIPSAFASSGVVSAASPQVDHDLWTHDEMGKSHGPSLSDAPSDARLAAGVADLAPRCPPDQMAESYPITSEADAAARVRAWVDKGDAAARARHPVWARTLPDLAYVVPAAPKRASSSALSKKRSGAPGALHASTDTSSDQQQQQPPPKAKPAASKRRRDPSTPSGASKRTKVDDTCQEDGDAKKKKKKSTEALSTGQKDAHESAMDCDAAAAAHQAVPMANTPAPTSSSSSATPSSTASTTTSSSSSSSKRARAMSRPSRGATLTTVWAPGSSDSVSASGATDLLRPGRLLRIVQVVYEEVDATEEEAMDVCDVGVRLVRHDTGSTTAHANKRSNTTVVDRAAGLHPTQPPVQTAPTATPSAAVPSAKPTPTVTAASHLQEAQAVAPGVLPTAPSGAGASAAVPTPTRSRSRAAEALTPCPDLVARLTPRVLDDETVSLIKVAPLAQKPTLTTKKCVYMLADGAYKGPYAVDQRADVVRVVRTLYRERVMRDLWGDSIVARHEPVFDPHARVIYLRMDLVGDRGPDGPEPWTTVTHMVKRGRSEHSVDVVNRDSHGLVIINTMEWLGSQNFVDAFAHVVVHMAARYLIDGGDANLNNIIGCPRRGAASVTAVDIEDNRNRSREKKKKPKKLAATAAAASQQASDGGGDPGGDGDESPEAVVVATTTPATAPAAHPTLMRCLFSPGRGPKADEQPTFDALLREHMGVVRAFTERVNESLKGALPGDIIPGAADYARDIGYYVNPTASAEVPTCGQIKARLDVLEACLDQFEGAGDDRQVE